MQLHGVNDAVTITSNNGGPLAVSVAEDTTAVATIVASDVDLGDTFTWSLDGADKSRFNISNTGVITFKNAPDFESPGDSGNNNVYDLIVSVSDGTVTDTQAVAVTVTNGNEPPGGANNNIQIREDVTYTFKLSDFGFSDSNNDAFGSVAINYVVNSLPGHLLWGDFGFTPGQVISAANIEAGMLTFKPREDVFSGNAEFTFSVIDALGAADPTPNTMGLTFTGGNQTDNTGPGGAPTANITITPSVLSGFQSFRDPFVFFQTDSDAFVWNQSGGGVFSALDMTRSSRRSGDHVCHQYRQRRVHHFQSVRNRQPLLVREDLL